MGSTKKTIMRTKSYARKKLTAKKKSARKK